MPRTIKTPDYAMREARLCWRARDGKQWGKGEYFQATSEHHNRLLKFLDATFPEFEHWFESREQEKSDGC